MGFTKLMSDRKAADIYASLDYHIPPAVLADNYLQAKLSGNKSECLALEIFIRDLARTYFNRADVLTALRDMETYKAMRKPGAGGSKLEKDIAGQIEELYAAGDFETLPDGRIKFFISTPGKHKANPGLLKVTCRNLPGAVALVCAKYRRGHSTKPGPARYGSLNWD